MKNLCLIMSLLLPLNFVVAQSVNVGNISKLTLCAGDTVWVPYTSSGSFKADNFFVAQLSDGNGSFNSFSNIGHSTDGTGSIPVLLGSAANHYRVRVIATDPYTISSNTSPDIRVFNYPSPDPFPYAAHTYFGPTAFIGDPILFIDRSSETSGSKYLWSFDQDASIAISSNPSPKVTYSSVGRKSGKLTVFNDAGCSTTSMPFLLTILTCNPQIPDSVHIVTGNESGTYPYVWVKVGGNYTSNNREDFGTFFIEPGGSLLTGSGSQGLYYVKTGASFIPSLDRKSVVAVLGKGLTFSNNQYGILDTFYCNDLQFDYSKVGGNSEVTIDEHPLQIQNSPNNLHVSSERAAISVSLVNLLGFPVASKTDFGVLNLDLTNFANGVYFAIINSGDHREVRKIIIAH